MVEPGKPLVSAYTEEYLKRATWNSLVQGLKGGWNNNFLPERDHNDSWVRHCVWSEDEAPIFLTDENPQHGYNRYGEAEINGRFGEHAVYILVPGSALTFEHLQDRYYYGEVSPARDKDPKKLESSVRYVLNALFESRGKNVLQRSDHLLIEQTKWVLLDIDE